MAVSEYSIEMRERGENKPCFFYQGFNFFYCYTNYMCMFVESRCVSVSKIPASSLSSLQFTTHVYN